MSVAEAATYHATHAARMGQPDDDVVDFYDSTDYEEVRQHNQRFAEDPRHMMLGLAFDGFQPFADDAKYSMWPLVTTSPPLCSRRESAVPVVPPASSCHQLPHSVQLSPVYTASAMYSGGDAPQLVIHPLHLHLLACLLVIEPRMFSCACSWVHAWGHGFMKLDCVNVL